MRHFFIEAALAEKATIQLEKDLQRRLTKVLRLKDGAKMAVFNGKDGLFEAELAENAAVLCVGAQLKPFQPTSPITLYLGLPKRETMDRVLRQATEMGVMAIQPVLTEFTVPDKLNVERAQHILVEAAEQCERLDIPLLHEPVPFQQMIKSVEEPVFWAYERQQGEESATPALTKLIELAGVLVGPEGGFSEHEVTQLQKQANIHACSLGHTILRVDTAVVAALSQVLCTEG